MAFIDRLYPLVQQLLWVHVSTLHFFLYLSLYVFPATEAANVLRPGNGPKLLKIVSCHSVIMVFIDRLSPSAATSLGPVSTCVSLLISTQNILFRLLPH